jgi:phage shock protein A
MTTDLQRATKGFFDRPEGKTGLIFIAALVAAGGWGLYKLLPYIIVLLENSLYASLLGAGLLVLTSPLWSDRMRLLVTYGFKSLMRAITSLFIEIDPIGILKSYVEEARRKLGEMDGHVSDLRGSITKLQKDISVNEQEAEKELQMVKVAREQGRQDVVTVSSRQHGRLVESNKKLRATLNGLNGLYGTLNKMREVADMTVRDMENNIRVQQREHEALKAGYGAFTSAMKILKGDDNKRELFEQTLEYLADDYANKVGEIDHFMDMSKTFFDSIDLQNGVFEQQALEALNARLEQQTVKLLGPATSPLVLPSSRSNGAVPVEVRAELVRDPVAEIFGKKG